jgi:ABC-type sugar transport system permease subunit
VTAPLNYAAPLVDPMHLATITVAVLYLWPALLVGIVALLRWRSLKQRLPFFVLGYLTCAGVEVIARRIGWTFSWSHYIGAVPQDQLVVAVVDTSLSVTAFSVVLSVAPVLWLAHVCSQSSQSPNNRWRGP